MRYIKIWDISRNIRDLTKSWIPSFQKNYPHIIGINFVKIIFRVIETIKWLKSYKMWTRVTIYDPYSFDNLYTTMLSKNYRTKVNLGSDLWVYISVRDGYTFLFVCLFTEERPVWRPFFVFVYLYFYICVFVFWEKGFSERSWLYKGRWGEGV